MTRIHIVVVGLIMSVSGFVQGQEETPLGHLKKDKPNELFLSFHQDEICGDSYERIVNNELTQSRIKRMEEPPENGIPFLSVVIACTGDKKNTVFSIVVTFQRKVPAWNQRPDKWIKSWTFISHHPGYSKHGYIRDTPEERGRFISNHLRDTVEDALSDYLRINFDL